MENTFLLNDFYTIVKMSNLNDNTAIPNTVTATLVLNASHAIFNGHFEQMPVVPGVCQTQIIKEVLQEVLKRNLTLHKASNIKYTGMIVPTQHPSIELELSYKINEDQNYVVDAKLFFENIVFTKFKGVFSKS